MLAPYTDCIMLLTLLGLVTVPLLFVLNWRWSLGNACLIAFFWLLNFWMPEVYYTKHERAVEARLLAIPLDAEGMGEISLQELIPFEWAVGCYYGGYGLERINKAVQKVLGVDNASSLRPLFWDDEDIVELYLKKPDGEIETISPVWQGHIYPFVRFEVPYPCFTVNDELRVLRYMKRE